MINKIDGPGSIRSTQPIKRAGKAGSASGAGFSKALDDAGETPSAHGVSSTNAVTGILNVQEVDDALAHASKGKMRAKDILDRLESLRVEILSGRVSIERLEQLNRVVSSYRGNITDPNLVSILDEIDLRAKVELAKYVMGITRY